MFMNCFPSLLGTRVLFRSFVGGFKSQLRLVQGTQQLHFCEPVSANA